MNRVLVSVEGQTEETFVREVLRDHLWAYNVGLEPVILATKRVKQGNKFKGGLLSYEQARKEVLRLLQDSNVVAVTTMYDLYRIPNDFPGWNTRPTGSGSVKSTYLELAFQNEISNERFHPYLQTHEFEALLFVAPEHVAALFPEYDYTAKLREIRQSFATPEDINDHPNTAPSKRLLNLYPNYDKPLYGTLSALAIGLDAIRVECPHFRTWLEWLESLG